MISMKKVLYIDFDGTICSDHFWRSLPSDERQVIQKFLFGADKELVTNWMLGKHSAEEINELVAQRLYCNPKELWQIFVQDCEQMSVPSELIDLLQHLREHYVVVLITDNMDCFTRFTVPALQLANHFDMICNSSEEGRCKRDAEGASFTKYATAADCSLSDSILIDDSILNCHLFENLGGTSHMTTSLEETEAILKQLKTNSANTY